MTFIFDFGKELCGGIVILTFKADNIAVRVRFGESLTECCAELGGITNATNEHSLRDFTVNLQHFSDMTFGGTGFRFVRLDFFGEVSIKAVVAESKKLNKKPIYIYTIEEYINTTDYYGATVGRVCNRIAYGNFSLNKKIINFL